MKLVIFGATGGTGLEVVKQALAAGHAVTALARSPDKLSLGNPALTVVQGDVLDPSAVERVVAGVDAVICSLGNTANNPDFVVSSGTQVIVDAMQMLAVRRLIVVSSIGVGDSKDQVPFFFKALMKTVLKKAMQDKERQEQIVRASGLEWTIVRPGGLTDGPQTGVYKSGTDPKITAGQVSRADVADFVLKQLTDATYLHKAPSVT